jgi:hypothetical protein
MIPIYRLSDDIGARQAFWTYVYAQGYRWVGSRHLESAVMDCGAYDDHPYVHWCGTKSLRYTTNTIDLGGDRVGTPILTNSPQHLIRTIRALQKVS